MGKPDTLTYRAYGLFNANHKRLGHTDSLTFKLLHLPHQLDIHIASSLDKSHTTFRQTPPQPRFTMSALLSAAGGVLSTAAGTALKVAQENIVPILSEATKATEEFIVPAVTTAVTNPGPAFALAGKWIAEHPGQTAWYAASGATIAFPGLLAAPVIGALGWGNVGPVGGMCALLSSCTTLSL